MAESPDNKTDDAALKARLDKLSHSLGSAHKPEPESESASGAAGFGNAIGAGFRVVTELVAGVLVGGGIGWLVDKGLGTKPLMMILLGCLGLIGGFWNTVRAAMLPPGSKGRFGG